MFPPPGIRTVEASAAAPLEANDDAGAAAALERSAEPVLEEALCLLAAFYDGASVRNSWPLCASE